MPRLDLRPCGESDTRAIQKAFGIGPRAQYRLSAYSKVGFFALFYATDSGWLPRFSAGVARVEAFRPNELTLSDLWVDPHTPLGDVQDFLIRWSAALSPHSTLALDARPLIEREDYQLAAMFRDLANLESHARFVYRLDHPAAGDGGGGECPTESWPEVAEPVQSGGPPGDGPSPRVPNPV